MPQSTNLNTPPYFEDFSPDDNFHKVLFRPGFPLQARELTSLQSILQDQIEKFGSSIYKDGAMVIPGQVGYDLKYDAILIEDEYFGIQSDALVTNTNTDGTPVIVGKIIRGNTSGVKAKVVNALTSDQSEKGKTTIYIKYINAGGNDEVTNTQYVTFEDDEILLSEESFSLGTTVIQENTDFAKCITSQATATGSSAKITAGIYFIKGNFVTVPEQEIVLDQFGVVPSYRVGLQVLEEIITPEDDSTLNDPSQGYSNYSAPGAHRLKFRAVLVKKALDDTTVVDFIELLKLEEGKCQEIVNSSKAQIAATLEDTLARRTFDESGDYEVTPYQFSTQECLDDGDNNGVFQFGEETSTGATPSDDLFEVVVSPGKAYVRGYEIETIANTYVDIEKPRTTQEQNNKTISTDGRGLKFNLASNQKIPQSNLSAVLSSENRTVELKESTTVIGFASLIDYTQSSTENFVRLSNIVITDPVKKVRNVDRLSINAVDYTLVSGSGKFTGSFKPFFFEVFGENDIKTITDLKVQNVLTHHTGTTTPTSGSPGNFNDINISGEYYSTNASDYTIRVDNEDAQNLALTSIGVTGGTLTATITGRNNATAEAFTLFGPQKISNPNITLSSLQKMRILQLETDAINNKYNINDEILRLGLTRACKIHAIYNSDTKEEAIPEITLEGGSGTFSVGEIVEGLSSGAKARIISQSGTTVYYTYIGKIRFVINENIKSKETGITRTISAVNNNGAIDIKKRYKLDDGQRPQSFDWSSLRKRSSASSVSGKLWIVLDWFKDEVPGKFYTVNSYYDADYKEIPYFDYRGEKLYLSNLIDWRTNQDNALSGDGDYTTPYTINLTQILSSTTLADFENRNYNFGAEIIPTGTTDGDIEYYLARIDDLYLDNNGNFINKKGNPSLTPQEPEGSLANAMKVGQLTMPAYVRDLEDVVFERSTNRRYTMKDIGQLENRIQNVEYYTQLSLLETDTANLFIPDGSGNNRLKNGFLVDNFTSHDIGQPFHPNYQCSIDFSFGELRPQHYTTNVSLVYKEEPTNYIKGDLLMLDFTDQLLVEQPYAAVSENVNPFAVVSWVGLMNIFPASDDWVDEKRLPETLTPVEGDYSATITALGADPNTGFAPTEWNAWETQWSSTRVRRRSFIERRGQAPFIRRVTRTRGRTRTLQTRTGIRPQVTPRTDRVVLGDRVVETKYSRWKRSRNFLLTAYRLKPNVRVYPFLEGRSVSTYATPKIIEIEMRGNTPFQAGENITLSGARQGRKFKCKLASPKGSIARLNKPYEIDPYTGNTINITAYNNSSTFLNLNLSTTNKLAGSEFGGYLVEGDIIIGLTSGATAKVTKKHLIADEKGNLRASIFIPDPSVDGNPRWKTGDSVVRLTDSPTNSQIPGVVDSSAENTYSARGTILTKQQDTLLVRNADVNRDTVVTDRRIITSSRTTTRAGGWYDPLAQSFLVEPEGGCFISKIDVFFRTKDNNLPVTMQIREMVNGYPSPVVLATENKDPSDVFLSDDATVSTTFVFETPVYLAERKEYCFVLLTSSVEYNVWLSEMGKDDLNGERISKQPYAGVLFKSQNASTWTTAEYQDMKFKIFRCKFKTNETPTIDFINDNTGNLFFKELRQDPIELTVNESGTARGYLKVNHKNHGLHDDSSFVEIKGVSSGISAKLAADWTGLTGAGNAITLEDTTGSDAVRNQFYASGSSGSEEMIFNAGSTPTRNGILGATPSAVNPGYIVINGIVYSYDPTAVGSVSNNQFSIELIARISDVNPPSGGFKVADEWEAELYVKNGIPLTLINKVHQNLKFITLDSYQIDFNSYRRNKDDSNVTFGGDEVTASSNLQYTSFMPTLAFKELPGTTVESTFKGTSGTSIGDGKYSLPTPDVGNWYEESYKKDSSYKDVLINSNNYLSKPKVIASLINEQRQMSNANSFDFRVKLSSTVDNLSPVIDTDRISLVATNNRVTNFDGTTRKAFFVDDLSGSYTNIGDEALEDFNAATYITKTVTLNQECTSLKIILSAYNNVNTDFDVYVKLLAGDEENPDEIQWDEITKPSSYTDAKSEVDFSDYEFQEDLTGSDTFTQYAIKIRLRSNNACDVPLIKDLRCIALA